MRCIPGDLLLYVGTTALPGLNLLAHFQLKRKQASKLGRPDTGHFTHAAIFAGDGKVLESTMSGGGVQLSPIKKSVKGFCVFVFRARPETLKANGWTGTVEEFQQQLMDNAHRYIGSTYPSKVAILSAVVKNSLRSIGFGGGVGNVWANEAGELLKSGILCSQLYILSWRPILSLPPASTKTDLAKELENFSPAFLAASPSLEHVGYLSMRA